GSLAALFEREAFRSQFLRLSSWLARCCTNCQNAIGGSGGTPVAFSRNIEAMRWQLVEHAHAFAHLAEGFASSGNLGLAFHHNEDYFCRPGFFYSAFAGLQAVETETDIAPAGILGRDVVN